MAAETRMSLSLLQPSMDYTCARTAVLDSPPAIERLQHRQLDQHQEVDLCRPDLNQESLYYHQQHQHLHLNLRYQPHQPQHQHPHHSIAVGGHRDPCDELVAPEVEQVPFDSRVHHEKLKHGLLQHRCIDECRSNNFHKPCEETLIPVRLHEDACHSHRTCEDATFSPTHHETVQFAFESMHPQHQPPSSMLLVQPRIKLLCSIGGRIIARPVDGKLRYCGGETRIITVDRCLCFAELMHKMTQIYGSPLSLKYQLPGEDLDALVSVSSDDDLQNMLDEYDKLAASDGNSWLRLFLFTSPVQCEIMNQCDIAHGREDCFANAMDLYVNAINGTANNGVLELLGDGLTENDVSSHLSYQRVPFDSPNTNPAGPYFSKPTLCALSAPSSTPSSPSVVSRQVHHKICAAASDTCSQFSNDQTKCSTFANGFDIGTPEVNPGIYLDALRCDNQSHILVESPRIQHDAPFSRSETVWVNENGNHSGDPQEMFLQRHHGTCTLCKDRWHDTPKSFGLSASPCEAHCGNQLAAQPPTFFGRQGQTEDDFGRVDSVQHCHAEGHKQIPGFAHQGILPLHREGPAQFQRGLGYDFSCQTFDNQGPSPFSQEFTHLHPHGAHIVGTAPMFTMGSAPSSPRDLAHGRCNCQFQQSQVHRGISVSLGEHSHSKRPIHIGDQHIRKHGLPLLSRFCDNSNLGSDPATWHCIPNLGKGFDLDEQDQMTRKHIFNRSKSRGHLVDCHASDCAVYHGDSHILTEPSHGLYERCMYRHGCADYHDQKGLHLEKAKVFPVPVEFQSHMGERATNLRGHELEPENVFTGGNLTHIKLPQDYNAGDFSGQYFNHGQGALETRILGVVGEGGDGSMLKSAHVSQGLSTLGYKEPDCDLNSASFSSTDAVKGSMSGLPLEPPVWVDTPTLTGNQESCKDKEICTQIPAVDCMANNMHRVNGSYNGEESSLVTHIGKASKNSCFSHAESYTRGRSTTTFDESKAEQAQVSALIRPPEHSFDKGSVSYTHELQSELNHLGSSGHSQPIPSRILDSVNGEGSTTTLTLAAYKPSYINNINNATFSFAKGEEGPSNNGIVCEKEATALMGATDKWGTSCSKEGQLCKSGKDEVDTALQKISEQEIKPVEESKQQFAEDRASANMQGPKTVSLIQSQATSEQVEEEPVGSMASLGLKEDEKELPAKQAEAEAIARGLQIIRNDDLEDLKELGSGTYGTVFHGKWRGSDVAIKRIKASCFTGHPSVQERLMSDFWKEAATLSQLHHPNVLAFYGVVPDGPEGTLATVTEYMVNGSLRQVLVKKDRTIDRKKRLLIAMDAAFGMEYLHSKKIVHFDLKSENLLVNMRDAHRPICKVGDFGLSKVKHRTLVSGGVRGTLPWMAPELLIGKNLVTEKVDVYSFGIVMWELLTGEEPYANMHFGTIIGGIANNSLRPTIPSWCDPNWRGLMERCWAGNPADRPDFSVVTSELRAIAMSMNMK